MSSTAPSPFLSVIVPCRDEVTYIQRCVSSLAANDYPRHRFEVIVVDGMSTDGTRERVRALAGTYPMIRVVNNPARVTPVAMNLGIAHSRGDVVMIAGAHNEYDSTYLRTAVEYLERWTDADAVGGVVVTSPRTSGRTGRAIARVISHPFGVGGSRFRTIPRSPVWADTAFGCCYRRAVFDRVGLFNERLTRGQDMELNLRLRAAGGRILLVPVLSSTYYARSTLVDFWAHNVVNGTWAILPSLHSPVRSVAARHLVPLLFVSALIASAAAAVFAPPARWLLAGLVGTYGVGVLAASVHVSWITRDPRLLLPAALAFANLHIGYGLGSLVGAVRVLWRRVRGSRPPRPADAWPSLADYESRVAVT